ncbi:MAG: hypothetical protein Q7T56_14150 [Nocardioidaceae bacterium]|nr:hypothetical protein [Nocardioidaceae bacterium]
MSDDVPTPRQRLVGFVVAAVVLAVVGVVAADAVAAAGLLGAPGLWLVVGVVAIGRPRLAGGVLVLGVVALGGAVVGSSDDQLRGFATLATLLAAAGGSFAWGAGSAVHLAVARVRRSRREESARDRAGGWDTMPP